MPSSADSHLFPADAIASGLRRLRRIRKELIAVLSIAAVAGALLMVASQLYQRREDRKKAEALAARIRSGEIVLERPHSPSLGPANAKVTLVEFLDPQCGSCRKMFPKVKELLASRGDVRLVVRYMPFQAQSVHAAIAAEAARVQGKYWEMLAMLFERQEDWGTAERPRTELITGYARALGLDMAAWERAMADPALRKQVETDQADAGNVPIGSVPTFFVNGHKFRGKLELDALQAVVDKQLQL